MMDRVRPPARPLVSARATRGQLVIGPEVPANIAMTDGEGRILRASRYWLDRLGYREQDVVGTALDDLIAPTGPDFLDERVADKLSRGESIADARCQLVRGDGGTMDILLSTAPMRSALLPNDRRHWVVMKDVTELRYVRQQLEESQRLYRAVFDQTFQFMVLLRPDGTVIEANRTVLDFIGVTLDEIKDDLIWTLPICGSSGEFAPRLEAAVREASAGNFARIECEMFGRGPNSLFVDISVKPVRDSDNQVVLLIFEGRDVTDRRAEQQLLLRSQKMEVLGQLTSGLAHDFNNLLAVIVGNLEMVQNRVKGDPRIAERAQRAIDAAFRGRELTKQMLAFARREQLNLRAVDLNRLIEEIPTLMIQALGDNIMVETRLGPDMWACWSDPNQIETIVLNLAVNARDAMPSGGRVVISTRNCTLPGDAEGVELPPGDYVLLSVSDEGEGIPPELIDRVFDPFFTTKPPGQGSGLGLSTAYGVVNQSGGDMRIRSELGVGTTVDIFLPRSAEAGIMVTPAAEPAQPAALVRSRILVVEDDRALRELVVDMLRDRGFAVRAAAKAETALNLLNNKGPFDLLFTDIRMPGAMDGRALADQAIARQSGLKVLLCSAARGASSAPSHLPFIAKPYRQRELIARIQELLSRPPQEPASAGPS